MAFIDNDIFEDYFEAADELITNDYIGKTCTLNYPPEKTTCPNCITVRLASGSSNQYKTGGPVPFTDGICPYCGGVGYLETANTEDIKLRIYWNKRDWSKVAPQIQVPDAQVMTIGFLSDMTKCLEANHIVLVSDQDNLKHYRFVLAGEPYPHGFGKSRYFVAYWKRDA